MKFNSHFHFYSRIAASVLIGMFGLFLLHVSVDTTAQQVGAAYHEIPIGGWAWSEKAGWISLNCMNDYDGDGVLEDSCLSGPKLCTVSGQSCTNNNDCLPAGGTCDFSGLWGLKVRTVDGKSYVQGCAWASSPQSEGLCSINGQSCTNNNDCLPAGGTCDFSTLGWICFSKPAPNVSQAPTNGVSFSSQSDDYTYSTCDVIQGVCQANLINPADHGTTSYGYACTDYSNCSTVCDFLNPSDTVKHCLNVSPARECTDYRDCQYGCGGGALENPQELMRGVCYDYHSGRQSLYPPNVPGPTREDLKTTYDPFASSPPTGWAYCYVSRDCAGYAPGGQGAECIFPQLYDHTLNRGRGHCSNGIINSEQLCTYDDDCTTVGYYCKILFNNDFIDNPSVDCTESRTCSGGYQCTDHIQRFAVYSNSLNPNPNDPNNDGFASILKLENPSDLSSTNYKLGFPLYSQLNDRQVPGSNLAYDVDNPNINSNNPIQGCFNCYQQKTFRCSTSNMSCSCSNPQDNSCESNNCDTINGELCVLKESRNLCDNCLEYFYYTEKDFPKVCSLHTSTICNNASDCPSAGETCDQASGGNKCVTVPDGSVCNNHPAIPCENSRVCPAGDTCVNTIIGSCTINPASGADNCVYPRTCEKRSLGDFKKLLMGYNCSDCHVDNYSNSCELNAYNKNTNSCHTCLSIFRAPGVVLDNKKDTIPSGTNVSTEPNNYGHLCGWGFNGLNNSISALLGWIQFSPRITTSTNPYFAVDQGSIYSKNRIVSPYHPPFGKYNASYLIESGGNIVNFVSSSTVSGLFAGELSNRPYIDFLQPLNINGNLKFKNALGNLDYTGLITTARSLGIQNFNKYGSEIIKFVSSSGVISTDDSSGFIDQFRTMPNTPTPLDNKVLYIAQNSDGNASLHIQDALSIASGSLNKSGAGIIIVEGSLYINNDVVYDSSSNLDNLKYIPSLVWIVLGDVKIDPSVKKLAGTFIVLGKTSIPDCSTGAEGCGKFISGFYSAGSPFLGNQLVVSGSVLAKKFILNRIYYNINTGAPAEEFINDGRLQANPPPGMTDLSKVIPRFGS